MNAEEFKSIAMRLYGPKIGWQKRCAVALKTDPTNVCRWVSGLVPVPGPACVALECLDKLSYTKKARKTHA